MKFTNLRIYEFADCIEESPIQIGKFVDS